MHKAIDAWIVPDDGAILLDGDEAPACPALRFRLGEVFPAFEEDTSEMPPPVDLSEAVKTTPWADCDAAILLVEDEIRRLALEYKRTKDGNTADRFSEACARRGQLLERRECLGGPPAYTPRPRLPAPEQRALGEQRRQLSAEYQRTGDWEILILRRQI